MKKLKLFLYSSLLILSSSLTFGQSWDWAKAEVNSVTGICDPYDLTTDNLGNIYESGSFYDTINFGSIAMSTSRGTYAIFLTKFDNSGNPLWGVSPTNTGTAINTTVATGKSGNVCLAGYKEGTMNIGSFNIPYTQNYNLFLATFSSTGVFKWGSYSSEGLTGSDFMYANSATIDDSDNTYVTGYFVDSIYVGSVGIFSNYDCFFLGKYNSAGTLLWIKTAKNITSFSTTTVGSTVVTDAIGNVYVVGTFTDSLTIGATTITTAGYQDLFLAKFTSAGNLVWVKSATLPSLNSSAIAEGIGYGGRYLSIDNNSNLYITGLFTDTVQFGTNTLITDYGGIFIAKYSPSGNVIWANESTPLNDPNSSQYYPYGISCDKHSNFYVCGTFYDSIQFNSVKLVSDSSLLPSYLYEFDSSGAAICGSTIDNWNDDNNCVAANPLANTAFFSGDIESPIYPTVGCYFGTYYLTGLNEYGFLSDWTCNSTSSINELKTNNENILVYPNPSNGIFTFVIASEARQSQVEVYNILGEKIYSQLSIVNSPLSINLSNQPNGIYLYRVINNSGQLIGDGKLIIQK